MKEFSALNGQTKIFICCMIVFLVCSSYYVFRNYSSMNNQLKVILILLSIGSIFLAYDRFEKNRSFNNLVTNFEITKGKILKVFISNKTTLRGGSARNDVTYSYTVQGKDYVIKNIENEYVMIPDIAPKTDFEYIVIYQKDNANNSILLLQYPLLKPQDLENYEYKFKKELPKDIFKNNW